MEANQASFEKDKLSTSALEQVADPTSASPASKNSKKDELINEDLSMGNDSNANTAEIDVPALTPLPKRSRKKTEEDSDYNESSENEDSSESSPESAFEEEEESGSDEYDDEYNHGQKKAYRFNPTVNRNSVPIPLRTSHGGTAPLFIPRNPDQLQTPGKPSAAAIHALTEKLRSLTPEQLQQLNRMQEQQMRKLAAQNAAQRQAQMETPTAIAQMAPVTPQSAIVLPSQLLASQSQNVPPTPEALMQERFRQMQAQAVANPVPAAIPIGIRPASVDSAFGRAVPICQGMRSQHQPANTMQNLMGMSGPAVQNIAQLQYQPVFSGGMPMNAYTQPQGHPSLKINLKNFLNAKSSLETTARPAGQFPSLKAKERAQPQPIISIAEGRQRRQRKAVSYKVQDDDADYEMDGDAKELQSPKEKKARTEQVENSEDHEDEESEFIEIDHTVEKIYSTRLAEDGSTEYLIKWKDQSYLHMEWLSDEEMREQPQGAMRIKKFLKKPLKEHHFSETDIFNPVFTKIDRILDETVFPGDETQFLLIKFCALPYDLVAWEPYSLIESLPEGPAHIAFYEKWKSSAHRASPRIGERPPKSDWSSLEETPKYKNGNMLRQYQLEGLNWLMFCWYHRQSCIIADEMGLGKTVQTVAFLDQLHSRFKVHGPFLVVAPLSTIPHWEREFAAWTDLRVLTYHGTAPSRDMMHQYEFYYLNEKKERIPNVFKFDVIITTYEMAINSAHHLSDVPWRVGIFDEAHRLKNKKSRATELLKSYYFEHKIMATGTPLQNSMEELWSLLNFIDPIKFGSEDAFLNEFGDLKKSEDVDRIQKILKPLMLRRLKEDVEKSIPVKEETIIEVELTSIQKRYYRAILERNLGFLTKGAKSANAPNLINTMMELRKCCIHPYLIKGAEDRILTECNAQTVEEQYNCLIQASGKLVLVDKLLKKLKDGGHKVLIFSQMTKCLDILADFLKYRNYNCERIDGAVRGDMRQAAIDKFCAVDSDSFVFLLCTKAGGVGINLTAADTVVIFDSDWNPQNDLQAQARCHRIGQTKSVKVYRLITTNSYEREMFDRAGLKLGLDRAVLQRMGAMEDDKSMQLDKKEVETLLKKGAYGVLMDDEDSLKFCDEDIDQILERRTKIIKHDGTESSIFSKAAFTAENNDFDIDVDDPNFWELWAKKANSEGQIDYTETIPVDQARIKRQLRRIKADEVDVSDSDHEGNLTSELWTLSEKKLLLSRLCTFGLARIEAFEHEFPMRDVRDILAVTRSLLKFSIEVVGEDDTKFKEDTERLLLLQLNEYMELALEQSPDDSEAASNVAKKDRPYEGASAKKVAEFKSFMTADATEFFRLKARKFVLRLQLHDFLRQAVADAEEVGYHSIEIPMVAGTSPAPWWEAEEDQCLLFGLYKHGYNNFEQILTDPLLSFVTHKPVGAPWPSKADLNSRVKKLLVGSQKRKQVQKKMEDIQDAPKRRRTANVTDVPSSPDGETHDKHEKHEAPSSPRKRKSRSKKGQWTRKDKADFLKGVTAYGLPLAEDGKADWEPFRQITGMNKTDEDFDFNVIEFLENLQWSISESNDIPESKREDLIAANKAAKIISRLNNFLLIRQLPESDLQVSEHTASFPKWWQAEHDKALLIGVKRHGISRSDLIIADLELPFHLVTDDRRRRRRDADEQEMTPEKIQFPSESLISKKFDALCEILASKSPKNVFEHWNIAK